MKIFLFSLVVIIMAAFSFSFKANKSKNQHQGLNEGFALVELFTSEGCSSCPPADAAIEEIQRDFAGRNVLVLGYHVDYWDRLGWKDIFSDPRFTARQSYYSNIFSLNSIYTPQAVVNGEREFVGSDKSRLVYIIKDELTHKSANTITLKAIHDHSGNISVTYLTPGKFSNQDQLAILLVQKSAINKIRKGENEGKTLRHINIVRSISYISVSSKEGKATFKIPNDSSLEDFFIAAFVQNSRSGKIAAIQSSEIK